MEEQENIIDATQDAVINASEEIVETIESTIQEVAPHHDAHHGPFYLQAEFWVAMSFVLVVILLFRPISKIGKSLILKRIDNIAKTIHDSSQLKEDAQKLLAEYESKFLHAKEEAAAILEKSKKEIAFVKKESLAKLEHELKIKEKDAEDRINSAKDKAQSEIQNLTSSLTIKAVKDVLAQKLDTKAQDKLIDASIEVIGKI